MNFFYAVNAATAPSVTPGGIVTANLINYLDFSDASCYSGAGSTMYDLVASLSYTISGASFLSGTAGGVFSFDGVNDYIISNANVTLNTSALTLGFWINQNPAETGRNTIFAIDNGASARLRSRFNNAARNPALTLNGTETYLSAGTNTGVWFYYAVTWNTGGTATHYVNGVSIGTASSLTSSINITRTINIGRVLYPTTGSTDYFFGLLGEVHFYNALLTGAEVLQNFNATRSRYGI